MTYRPDIYDAVTPASIQGDAEWYESKARALGGPVLELGAGSGRITLRIAQSGIQIYALDADSAMLGALRRKLADQPPDIRDRVTVVAGDMRTCDLRRQFPLIVAPFRAFLHNRTERDQLACLDCVRKHLTPNGTFAFNVFHPSLEYMSQNAGALTGVWRATGTFDRPDGSCLVRSEANRYDTVAQRVDSLHRYDEYAADGTLVGTSLHRLTLAYLYPADIRRLLGHAGFESIQISGGFDGRPFEKDTDELVVEARVLTR